MKTRIAIAFAVMLLGILACYAQSTPPPPSVTLAWTPVTNATVTGYNLYIGVQSRVYTNHVYVTPRTINTVTIGNLERGVTYYFAATSTNSVGLESVPGNEVSYTTMPLPPTPIGLTVTPANP